MYCVNCGKEVKVGAKFCGECGTPVVEVEELSELKKVALKMDTKEFKNGAKKVIVPILIVGVCVILIPLGLVFFILIIYNSTIGNIEKKENINLSGIDIPAYYSVIEEGELCSYSSNTNNGNKKVELRICKTDNFKKNVTEYFDLLVDEYEFVDISKNNNRLLRREDIDKNYTIEISYDLGDNKVIYNGREGIISEGKDTSK